MFGFLRCLLPRKRKKRVTLDAALALERLLEVVRIFERLGKPMWLTDGTLLGFHRQGGFLGHDLDMDIAAPIACFDDSIAQAFLGAGWQLKRMLGEVTCGLEQTWVKGDVYLDIFYFYPEGERLWHGAWRRDKQTKKRNLIKYYYEPFTIGHREYLGHVFPVPEDVESYVAQKYGPDWRIPRTQWDWALDPHNAARTDIWR